MEIQAAEQLIRRKCRPCEGGLPAFTRAESQLQLERLPGWQLTDDGQRICREWKVRDFVSAMAFFNRIAEIAEDDGHHPDLHLEGYRHVRVELWTHAIGGLSENDFILAAKIDQLPVDDRHPRN